MPVPMIGLAPQPAAEDTDAIGTVYTEDSAGYSKMSASVTYTLWRNPSDRSDPVNLAELDEAMRTSLETEPPWPRPPWLIEQVERMKYPMLWEAVRTTWHRDEPTRVSLPQELVDHVNHVLMNRYREASGHRGKPWETPRPRVDERSVHHAIAMRIDGREIPGAEIDTDPFVYGVGAELGRGVFITAVIPRAHLEHIHIEFSKRNHGTQRSPRRAECR